MGGGRACSEGAERLRGMSAGSAFTPGHTLAPGTQLRDYRLDQVLGEGGFGTVWLAERRNGAVVATLAHAHEELGDKPW